MPPVRGSFFTFPAGRRAKWVVFAIWFVGDLHRRRPGQPARQVRRRRKQRGDLLPAGDAESTKALNATESLQNGEIAPAVIIYRRESGLTAGRPPARSTTTSKKMTAKRFPGVVPDGATAAVGRQAPGHRGERREAAAAAAGCGTPTSTVPGQPADYAPFVGPICSQDGKAAIVTAYIKGKGEGERILDPVKFWREQIADPRRRPGGRRSPAAPASPPTRSKSSKGSTAPCCWPRSAS